MSHSARPSVFENGSTTSTVPPTQEDQIRNYQQFHWMRYNTARGIQRRFGSRYNRILESAVSPERQLELSRERRSQLVPAEVLYSSIRNTIQHRVYQHYSETRILVTDKRQVNLNLCNEQSYQQLRRKALNWYT